MAESYSSKVVHKSTPEQVSKLMRLDETTPEAWQREDLTAMVRHQLSATLEFDLSTLNLDANQQEIVTQSGRGPARSGLRTFGELFQASRPQVDLLRLSQKFFKQRVAQNVKGSPEQKVAYLFYLLSILVARIRAGVRISKLPDPELVCGIRSVLNRPWVAQPLKELLLDRQKRIAQESSRGKR
jgi:hypothetical protein